MLTMIIDAAAYSHFDLFADDVLEEIRGGAGDRLVPLRLVIVCCGRAHRGGRCERQTQRCSTPLGARGERWVWDKCC